MNRQIEKLRRQIEIEQRRLDETCQAIATVSQFLEAEKLHTQKLVQDSQKKPESQQIPQKPSKPSKAEQIAKMSDHELVSIMQNPLKTEQLFKDL